MATLCGCTEQNLPNNSNGSNEENKDTKDTTNINGGDNEQYIETYRWDGYETYWNDTAFFKNVLFYNAESILDSTYAYSGRNNQWIPSSKCVCFKDIENNNSRETEYDYYLYQEDVWVLYQHHKSIISNNKVQKTQIDVWHNIWERYQEYIYSYNSHGDMILIETYFYDDNSYVAWKEDYYYTNNRKDSLYSYRKDSINQTTYRPISKTIYNRYDARNNIEEETSYSYKNWQETTLYLENYKYIRVYDSHRNIIKEEYYSWQDNQWRLYSTTNYERTYIDGTDYQSKYICYTVYENGHNTFKSETINHYTKVKVKANVAKRLMRPIVQEPRNKTQIAR